MKIILKITLLLLIVTAFVYLPFFVKPELLLNRNNDLEEFFWPMFYFVKTQILTNHQIPLWNNLILSGTPLLPDPQVPFFYLPNVVFLFLSIDQGFLVSFFLHTFLAGVFAYFCAKEGLGFSRPASLFSAALFISSPKLAGYLEAGHFGLIASWTWLPLVILALIKISQRPKLVWVAILSLAWSAVFYTHLTTFLLAFGASNLFFLYLVIKNKNLKPVAYFFLASVLTFCLATPALLPQLAWKDQTTRFLLLKDRDTYPKWSSLKEFFRAILVPVQRDTEKWLTVGFLPAFLALLGFLKLKRGNQVLILVILGVIALLVTNNVSPFYPLLLEQDWFVLLRVATRTWFLVVLLVVFLAGYAFEKFAGQKRFGFTHLLALLATIESIGLAWFYYQKPFSLPRRAPQEVYEFIKKDKDRFRVFCTTFCFSQKEAALYNLELIEGYNTLQQTNYYKHAWQLTNSYWNYYTLSIPPMGIYTFEKLQPQAKYLGEYNVKYVVSPHKLEDPNFVLRKKFANYLVYENSLFEPRASVPIVIYTPNFIRVDVTNYRSNQLLLREVYSPGWRAFLNGQQEVPIQETPIAQRVIDLPPNIRFVDFKYSPTTFRISKE